MIKWIYYVDAGTHIIQAIADSDNQVPESDETNNSKTVTLVVS